MPPHQAGQHVMNPAESNGIHLSKTNERHDDAEVEQLTPLDNSLQATYQNCNKIVVGPNEFVNIYMRCGVDGKKVNPITGKNVTDVLIQTKIEKRSKDDTIPQCQPPRTCTLVRMAPIVEFKREVIPVKRR